MTNSFPTTVWAFTWNGDHCLNLLSMLECLYKLFLETLFRLARGAFFQSSLQNYYISFNLIMQYSILNIKYKRGFILRKKIKEVKPRLHQIINEHGLSQVQLAKISNVPQSYISRFDKQENHNDLYVLRILHSLEISIEELFDVIYEE